MDFLQPTHFSTSRHDYWCAFGYPRGFPIAPRNWPGLQSCSPGLCAAGGGGNVVPDVGRASDGEDVSQKGVGSERKLDPLFFIRKSLKVLIAGPMWSCHR